MTESKAKLEVIWTNSESGPIAEPHFRIEFARDPQSADSTVGCLEAIPCVCGKPRCSCLNVQIEYYPVLANAEEAPPCLARKFWFDLDSKLVVKTPELEKDPESLRLGEIISVGLTEADQQRLREWFLAEKLILIQTTPMSKIDISNLPDADDGRMVGFVEVFPCGLALNFTLNHETWAVDEQYCVQPGCDCGDSGLTFLKLKDATGRINIAISDPPALRYNYRSGVAKQVLRASAEGPALDMLLAALKRAHTSLNRQLQRRHLIMQSIYARHFLAQGSVALNQPANLVSTGAKKTGRNEPCPCGSGRKYKHCCLNKPRQ